MKLNQISENTIGASIEVHRKLGPGLLESVYQKCLGYEISQSGLVVKEQVPVPITYKEVHLDHGYRLDLLIEDRIVVRLKQWRL